MALPLLRDLDARRNAPLAEVWRDLVDQTTGLPFDLSGSDLRMDIRLYEGAPGPALISLTEVTDPFVEGLRVTDEGLEIYIAAATLLFLPEARAGQSARFRYDLIVDTPTAVREVWASGALVVRTGVTNRLVFLVDEAGAFLVTDTGAFLTAG